MVEKNIHFYVVDAFGVAKKHAPTPDLEIRMMGIAFIGAICGHVDRIASNKSEEVILEKVEQQVTKKFGAKGKSIVEGNMKVVRDGLKATHKIDYSTAEFLAAEKLSIIVSGRLVSSNNASRLVSRSTRSTRRAATVDQSWLSSGCIAERMASTTSSI